MNASGGSAGTRPCTALVSQVSKTYVTFSWSTALRTGPTVQMCGALKYVPMASRQKHDRARETLARVKRGLRAQSLDLHMHRFHECEQGPNAACPSLWPLPTRRGKPLLVSLLPHFELPTSKKQQHHAWYYQKPRMGLEPMTF